MKKIISLFTIVALTSGAAVAAPSHITRAANGGYRVTYDYQDKAKSGWYVGGRAEMSFLNWKNKYTFYSEEIGSPVDMSDKYSMEPVFGGSLFGGFTFNYFWRAELELGYMGKFKESDQGTDFALSIPYAMANVYYDFTNDVYVGAGLGLALPQTEWDAPSFVGGEFRETSVSPMVGIMIGYSYELDDNLVLDLRYRLAGLMGLDYDRDLQFENIVTGEVSNGYFKNDIDLILDNSFSIGLRYEF